MIENKIFPLDLTKSTTELKELIEQYPDYPIVVLAAEDAVSDDYSYTYCSDITFGIGTILDCEAVCRDEKVYVDKDDLIEDMRFYLEEVYDDVSEEEFDKIVDNEVAKYDSYWKDVIVVYAGN